MDKTSAAAGVKLPLGASDSVIKAARELIARHGPDALGKAAKLHFRTTNKFLGMPASGHPTKNEENP
jgi:ribonuclease HIII